ncbi:OR4 protein, partial [Acromyrmex insinuator]
METICSRYYDIVYKISSLTGMWPYLKPKTRIFRITLLTIILLTILIPQIAYQFMCKKSLHCTLQAMTAYLLSFVALLKVYTFQFNIHTIKDLTQHLLCDWKELNTYEEYEIMKSYAANGRRFSLIYSVYCFAAIIVFMSMSLIPHTLDIILPLNESRPILPPYRGYYFVDIQEHFFQIFWHAIVAWEIVIAGIIAHDCLFVTYVEHVCSKFAITGFHYEHLFHDCKNKMEIVSSINPDDITIYYKRVAFLVRKHREALEYAQLLEDTFTMPFAIQILIVTIGMSITLLQITQDKSDILEAARYVFYIGGQLIHLFFLSFEGQRLIDHSLQIRDKMYKSFWYKASMKLQKIIMLVMMKSLYPSFLSAGKVYIFSLQSFTMVKQEFHYYGLVKKLSSMSGQWPYQKPITKLFCMILMTLSTISVIIPQEVFQCTDLRKWYVSRVVEPTLASLEEFQERDSGWVLSPILNLTMNANKHNPLHAGCHIKLSREITFKRVVINVQTADNACFAWSVVAILHPAQKKIERESSTAKFVICDGNLQCIFQTLSSYMLTTITLVKLYTCYFNRCKIKVLIDQLFVDWNELETPEEYEIMERYAKNSRRYSLGYSLYYYFGVYTFISLSLVPQVLDVVLPLNESRPILPIYPGYYFVDERKYFFYIFSHAVMAWEIAVTVILSHDCMLLTYIEHICSIFTLVGFRFERLIYNNTMKMLHSRTSDMYCKQITFSVEISIFIIIIFLTFCHRFAQLIGETFSLTLTIQLALNTIMISITLLQVTQQQAGILELIRYMMYVIGQLIHLFCLSFEGQKLIDHSLQTRDKIYNSFWYETPLKSQKMFLFIMRKSFQPIFLSASKMYIFSMENFTMIVQTSISYFTVLSSLE